VLAYASGLPQVDEKVVVRADPAGDGIEFIVAPPPLVRLVVGPSILAVVATLFLPAGAMALVGVARHAGELLHPAGVGASLLPIGFGVLIIGAWVSVLSGLVRVARHGREPFRMRIADGGYRVVSSPRSGHDDTDDAYADAEDTRRVADVRLSELSGGPLYRVAFLYISFAQDPGVPRNTGVNKPRGLYIAWPNRDPLIQWEKRLRDALVRRRPLPSNQENGEAYTCAS
jgi:hypothetical protein